jgi:exonuclease SbcD
VRYPGSPLQLDFGETGDRKAVLVLDAVHGRPVEVREVPLTAGRQLRTLEGDLATVLAQAGSTGDDFLRVRLHETPRVGLADEVREVFPECVDVQLIRPEGQSDGGAASPGERRGREPIELFQTYLTQTKGAADEAVVDLFRELLEAQST